MTQFSPSVMAQVQAMTKLREFQEYITLGKANDVDDILARIDDILSSYEGSVGAPMTEYDPVWRGEPPDSSKMNKFISSLNNDLNVMAEQLDVLTASALWSHNYATTLLGQADNENKRVGNKLKTLQLYSSAHDSNVVIFSDFFKTLEYMDQKFVQGNLQPHIIAPGHLALGRVGDTENLTSTASITILDESNGISGRNQEILHPSITTKPAITDAKSPANNGGNNVSVSIPRNVGDNNLDGDSDITEPYYVFWAEENGNAGNIKAISDDSPETWFEYECYKISGEDKDKAGGFNFSYVHDLEPKSILDGKQQYFKWADGPVGGKLKLGIQFDFRSPKRINNISYNPFGLESNENHPVKVSKVVTSEDGTNWIEVLPRDVWIGTDVNLKTIRRGGDVFIGSALWTFAERNVRYVKIFIEQDSTVPSNIGHLYYTSQQRVKTTTRQVDDPSSLSGMRLEVVTDTIGGGRTEGPYPPYNNPTKFYNMNAYRNGGFVGGDNVPPTNVRAGLLEHREYFKGERYAIGIRDITIEHLKYVEKSVYVSKPFMVNGIIDRVSLNADLVIPESFDPMNVWVLFYVSPDDGLNWHPISRIQDDFYGFPEVLAFNDPLPVEFREKGVFYIDTNNIVNKLRVKIELLRPTDEEASTPVLRSYELKAVKR